MNFYLIIFLFAALFSFLFTLLFKFVSEKIGALDIPDKRKVHKKPIARLGGVAFFIALFGVAFLVLPVDKNLLGVFFGSLVLLFFGIFDDIFGISPWVKLCGQIAAALIIVAFGIGIEFITNPFGGVIHLNTLKFPIDFLGTTYHIVFWADLFTLFWIILVINAVNFLDGIDGLASGVSGIAGIFIFFLSISPKVMQPDTAIFALILAGVAFGFLPLNFHPAKIFMGDSGSMFLGFILAVLAIISGGKVATALLLLGLPILDLFWAVLRRTIKGVSPFRPDKHHFHHELLKRGLTQKKTALIIYAITAFLGFFALLSETFYKFIGIVFLALIVALLIFFFYRNDLKSKIDNH